MKASNSAAGANPAPTIIDARGLKCPLPVLKLEKYLDQAKNPLPVTLYTDDPIARIDIPVLCNKRKLDCAIFEDGIALRFEIAERQD